MKQLFLHLFLTMLFNSILIAQNCLPGVTVLSTQMEVDSFSINYQGCSHILGSLIIEGETEISNLDSLAQITSIAGSLTISHNEILTSLNGFNNLTSIGSFLTISNNLNLLSLESLNNLTSVGKGVYITDNYFLPSLNQ